MKPQHPHIVCQISHVTKCSVTTCYDRATLPTLIEGTTFFSITEVAASCGVSRQTFWRWRQDGSVPQGRQDRHARLMFTEAELDLTRAFAGGVTSPRAAASTSIYLDNAASTRPLAAVRDAMVRAMELEFGNPSSAHSDGRRARQAVEDARDAVASLVGADPSSVIFTSGGTEANNWVLQGAPQIGVHRFIVSAAEHSSILGVLPHLEAKGFETIILPVDREGLVSQKSLESCVIDGKTLVSIQWANNETGVIQRVGEISNYVKSRGGFFHTDAVQIVGKQQIDFNQSSIDAMTITAHKIHGPQGVGALIRKQSFKPAPLFGVVLRKTGIELARKTISALLALGSPQHIDKPPCAISFGTLAACAILLNRNYAQKFLLFESTVAKSIASVQLEMFSYPKWMGKHLLRSLMHWVFGSRRVLHAQICSLCLHMCCVLWECQKMTLIQVSVSPYRKTHRLK